MGVRHAALFLLALFIFSNVRTGSSSYWGWTQGGCNASAPSDWNYYNVPQNFVASQWWTLTFTHSTLPIGGLLNFVNLASPSPVRFLQIAVTDGTVSPPLLISRQDPYVFSHQGSNPSSFCWGAQNTACFSTQPGLGSVHSSGVSDDKTFSWNLTWSNYDSSSWCMLNKANSAIGQGPLVWLSWRHAIPKAIVSGSLSIKGHLVDFEGVGQNDHVFGDFLPGVTTFQNWLDAHFFDPISGFNLYWGNLEQGPWTFARASMSGGMNYTFLNNEISFYTTCASSDKTRPTLVQLNAQSSDYTLIVSYSPIVAGLVWHPSPGRGIEDIVALTGTFCFKSSCHHINARGWGQVLGSSRCK